MGIKSRGKARKFGDGMGNTSDLEQGRPGRTDASAGDAVDHGKIGVMVDAVNETKIKQSIANLGCLDRAIRANHAIQQAFGVKDADVPWDAWRGIVGMFRADGKYFFVDHKGCFTLEQMCEHGWLHERELGYIKDSLCRLMVYWKKYIELKDLGEVRA